MRKTAVGVALAVTGSLVGAATISNAASSSPPLYACVVKSSGAMRNVAASTHCRGTERKISWNRVGTPGPAGPQGVAGATGAVGQVGRTGAMGDTGPAGAPGATGATGPAGSRGDVGPTGPTGAPGAAGAKGDTGPAGSAGAKGDTGAAGPQGPQGPTGAQGPQGPAGISNVTTLTLPAGTVVTSAGTVVGQLTLYSQNNYVVTAGVTALASTNDSLQCQLSSTLSPNWDDMGEADLTARATVPLEHAYPRSSTLTSYTVYVACRSAAADYVVDTGHLYAWQVGSATAPGSHVIYDAPKGSLAWEPMG